MAPGTPYFDLLDDSLVQQVITAILRPPFNSRGSSCRDLSLTCHRLCTLVRRTGRLQWYKPPAALLRVTRIPAYRAFTNVVSLTMGGRMADGVQDAMFVDAAAAAVAAWPGLEDVKLSCSNDACEAACASGAILALRAAPALRKLDVFLADPNSLAFFPVLTQLTGLIVRGGADGDTLSVETTDGSCPLAAMPHLVDIGLRMVELQPASCCALPPNITKLEVDFVWLGRAGWAQHVAGCRQLRELVVTSHTDDFTTHPTLVMQAVAGQLTQLQKLYIRGQNARAEHLEEVIRTLLPDTDSDNSDGEEQWWPQPVLGRAQGYDAPKKYMVVPPPNMGGLPALQHLEFRYWWLTISSERYWRHLAACSSLRWCSMHASVPPPAGMTFPGVTRLELTTSTSPGDTLALLAAFPALKELELSMVLHDAPEDTIKVPESGEALLTHLTTAKLFFHNAPQLSALALSSCVHTYCRALWSALPRLQQLELAWADPIRLLSHQLGLSALQQLTALVVGDRVVWARGRDQGDPVGPQQVVGLVQGAARLQAVTLYRPLTPGSSKDQLVLGLQGALPRLRLVTLSCGPGELEPATRAALRPGLFVSDLFLRGDIHYVALRGLGQDFFYEVIPGPGQ